MMAIRTGFVSACAALVLVSAPSSQSLSLTTSFAGGNQQNGNMFNVEALEDITISHFDIHLTPGLGPVEIYYRPGSWQTHAKNPASWTLLASGNKQSSGAGNATPCPDLALNVFIPKGETHAFYVTTPNGPGPIMFYSNPQSGETIQSFISNNDVRVYWGLGNDYPFGTTFKPRLWNGTVHYLKESFSGTPDTISVSSGGTQSWTMNAGASNADLAYLVLGSVTGSTPGLQLGAPTVVPINFDGWTEFTVVAPNTPPLSNSFNFLDGNGMSTGSFSFPGGLPASLIGRTFTHAFVTIKLEPGLLSLPFASNAVDVTMVP